MVNAGKSVGMCLAGTAAAVWRRWRRMKRRRWRTLVSGWLTLERDEQSVAGIAGRTAGETERVWFCWPL